MWEQDERAKQCVSQRGREDGGVCLAEVRNEGGEYEHIRCVQKHTKVSVVVATLLRNSPRAGLLLILRR